MPGKDENVESPMSHLGEKIMGDPHMSRVRDSMEKKAKELKEFSRLLVILSVAFITISSSSSDFKAGILSLHNLMIFVQLIALFSGVMFHQKYLLFYTKVNSLHQLTTSESADAHFDEMDQVFLSVIWWCSLQQRSFLLSFLLLAFVLFPWQSLLPILNKFLG